MNTELNVTSHETFSGEQSESDVNIKIKIRQQVNALTADLSATELSFAIEVNNALLGKLIKRVKAEGSDQQREQMYRILEQAVDQMSLS
ncbi:MAG: hypothetical protein CTY35_01945 [Methylotenera sp.]|uniref:hypothetical protein n=1 Tax=Methylotenera sp. TaxID=2051956 RepID=UPI000D495768|nr:hypothetical protein [Methylotenera sp.]PPC84392.1 MAG: hypothetical protein CTY38_02165 [Methylotenera sp.]PPD01034.1 MAG: hypothetical protein CTY35_01945 [Methylotenera sp.]